MLLILIMANTILLLMNMIAIYRKYDKFEHKRLQLALIAVEMILLAVTAVLYLS